MQGKMNAIILPILSLAWMRRVGARVEGGVVQCEETSACEARVGRGSVCADGGRCSRPPANPFERGCLRSVLGEGAHPRKRVCNSDDPDDASDGGICDSPTFGYGEVRIANQDWDQPLTSSWVMQILLSEVLHVPTTIETNSPDRHYSFYDPRGRADVAAATYPYDALRTARGLGGDCTRAKAKYEATGTYVPCANILSMVNKVGQADNVQQLMDEGIIDQPKNGGNFDQYRWWMPKLLARQEPSLLSYFGLSEDNNEHLRLPYASRERLAELFKRPTDWGTYCQLVSSDNCTTDDGVATRAPLEDERGKYFVDGAYSGHFRATEKNNCTGIPATCSGHISNVPCSWGNYAVAQAHHLSIPVSSDGNLPQNGGYGYSSLLEIYAAANATRENVLMYWWEPDTLIEKYRGTDYELVPINLPPTTKECVENRPSEEQRCSENYTVQIGSPLGSCDAGPVPNIILSTLSPCEPDEFASCSPAYATIQSYELNNLNLQQMFQYRLESPSNNGRDAVCRWFVENLEVIQKGMVPKTYPRQYHVKPFYQPVTYFSLVLSVLSVLCVLLCAFASKYYKKSKVMVYAQVDFLLIILVGLFLVAISAILYCLEPTKAVCIARPWFAVVGYSLELIPLSIKVAAINRICQQSRRMRKVDVKKSRLYRLVACCVGSVCIYMSIWVGLDPPVPQQNMSLSASLGNYTVEVSSFCASESSRVWHIAPYVYLTVLLLITGAIATQNRGIRQEFNESIYMMLLTYSHTMFIVLRLIMFFFSDKLENAHLYSVSTSLLLSIDTIIALGIYFLPKIVAAKLVLRAPREDPSIHRYDPSRTGQQASPGEGGSAGGRDSSDTFTWRIHLNRMASTLSMRILPREEVSVDRRDSVASQDSDSFTWRVFRRRSSQLSSLSGEGPRDRRDSVMAQDSSSFTWHGSRGSVSSVGQNEMKPQDLDLHESENGVAPLIDDSTRHQRVSWSDQHGDGLCQGNEPGQQSNGEEDDTNMHEEVMDGGCHMLENEEGKEIPKENGNSSNDKEAQGGSDARQQEVGMHD